MSKATSGSGHARAEARNVAAIAGRRIDAAGTEEPRFPERFAPRVSARIAELYAARGVGVVVASAACGADILALEAALEHGLRIRIVLPFERARFRETSVIDRGGQWGERYDRLLDAAAAQDDVIVLASGSGDDDAAYGRATARIIEEAATLAHGSGGEAVAIAIWDERPRSSGDATQDFVQRAERAGMTSLTVGTLDAG